MEHKPYNRILHPPELQGEEKRRYWKAVGMWFVCTMGLLLVFFLIFFGILYLVERILGEEYLNTLHPAWFLVPVCVTGIAAFILGDRLWGRLFIKSGYLSDAAVTRIMTNRAPTRASERGHRKIGLLIPLLLGIFFAWLAWRDRMYWGILGAAVFGLWLFISIYRGWKKTEAIKAGAQTPSTDIDKRAAEIEQVLNERKGR